MKRHIPNLITLMNLLCGSVATVFAVLNQLELAAFFVFLGIIFDFFDGLAARVLNVKSDFGIQLDSLADMVTSGLSGLMEVAVHFFKWPCIGDLLSVLYNRGHLIMLGAGGQFKESPRYRGD